MEELVEPFEAHLKKMDADQQRMADERNRWTALITATRENGKKLDRVITLLEQIAAAQAALGQANPPG